MNKLTDLGRAYIAAAPFLREGRQEVVAYVRASFVRASNEIVERGDWRLEEEKGRMFLLFEPEPFGAPFLALEVVWTDDRGAELLHQPLHFGEGWLAAHHALDLPEKAPELDLESASWTAGDESLGPILASAAEQVEAWFENWVAHQPGLQAFRDAENAIQACLVGREPWRVISPDWAEVRNGLAAASDRPIHLSVHRSSETPPKGSFDLIVLEGCKQPPSWTTTPDGRASLQQARLVVAVADAGTSGWTSGSLAGACPVVDPRVKGKPVDFAKSAPSTERFDLSWMMEVDPPLRVSGFNLATTAPGAATLLAFDYDGERVPFAAFKENDGIEALWLASGTGGYGKPFYERNETWERFWRSVLAFVRT